MSREFKSFPFEVWQAYSEEEAAQILHRTQRTVRSLIRSGELPATIKRGKYIISGADIRAYAEGRLPKIQVNTSEKKEQTKKMSTNSKYIVREILPNGVYNRQTAAELLHRSPKWLGKMCAAGRIQALKSGSWIITGQALLDFLQGR